VIFARHVPAVEVAQPRLGVEHADVARLEPGAETEPVQRNRAQVLQLDATPEADRHLPAVRLGKAEVGTGGVGAGVPVVEDPHHVLLAGEVGLDRRLAADDEQVVGREVGRDVEPERSEVPVVGAEQPPVEPDVGGEEGAANAEHHPTGMVGPGEVAAVPERAAPLHGQPLAGHLGRLPALAPAGRQTHRLAFAERHPE